MHADNSSKLVFIISRTDSIGDVMLTLPMAGILKREYPGCKVLFIGRTYTQAVVESSINIDGFINLDDFKSGKELAKILKGTKANCIIHAFPNKKVAWAAQAAEIPMRIGTSHRIHHWFNCNYPVNFTRKNSPLHEGELNLKLLKPLGIKNTFAKDDLPNYFGLHRLQPLNESKAQLLDKSRFNLILHPLSKGSAPNWEIEQYSRLIELLPQDKFKIFVTGTTEEGEQLAGFLTNHAQRITPLTGQLSLPQLIAFIKNADGLVAASTGPLHIASALSKHAVGLYSSKRPMHPGRWSALGKHVQVFVDESVPAKNLSINPEEVAGYLISL